MAFPIGNVKIQSMEEIYFSKTSEKFKTRLKNVVLYQDVIDAVGLSQNLLMKNKSLFFILGSNSFTGSHFVKYLIKKNIKLFAQVDQKEPKQHFLAYEKNNAYSTFYQLDINKNLKKIINLIKKKDQIIL